MSNLVKDLEFIETNSDGKIGKRWVALYLRGIGKLMKQIYELQPNEEIKKEMLNLYNKIIEYEKKI